MHFVDAKGILTGSGGHYGMNIYRGCTHGCIYCDSRSRCYQFTHPFEDIEVKQNAPNLLEKALKSKGKSVWSEQARCRIHICIVKRTWGWQENVWKSFWRMILGLRFRQNQTVILQDIDLLAKINRSAKCVVQMTLTNLWWWFVPHIRAKCMYHKAPYWSTRRNA